MKSDKDIQFIASHYRRDSFRWEYAWQRLGFRSPSLWKRYRIAAAIAGLVFISATAALVYYSYTNEKTVITESTKTISEEQPKIYSVEVIDFDNTPLSTVVAKINEIYAIEIVNVPDNADEIKLTLHYKGNALELVEAINDILGTSMTVTEQ